MSTDAKQKPCLCLAGVFASEYPASKTPDTYYRLEVTEDKLG